jgi:hypothetical protein
MSDQEPEYLSIELHHFPNNGYILTQAPRVVMEEIHQAVNDILTQKVTPVEYNKRLAGQIKHEYKIDFSDRAIQMIEFVGNEWHRKHGTDGNLNNQHLGAWVNLQTKHEFNPLHDHDGILSWVIWANIPYDFDEEQQVFPKARNKDVSKFGFVYTDSLGTIRTHSLPIDKTWEGRMIVFPAGMRHYVNPFYTSDGIRISVAGNLGVQGWHTATK